MLKQGCTTMVLEAQLASQSFVHEPLLFMISISARAIISHLPMALGSKRLMTWRVTCLREGGFQMTTRQASPC